MEIVKDENPEKKASKYDPAKKYRWAQNSQFYFNGGEFGVVLNALRQVLGTREAQIILLAERASELVEQSLAKAVETGIAVEEVDSKPQ